MHEKHSMVTTDRPKSHRMRGMIQRPRSAPSAHHDNIKANLTCNEPLRKPLKAKRYLSNHNPLLHASMSRQSWFINSSGPTLPHNNQTPLNHAKPTDILHNLHNYNASFSSYDTSLSHTTKAITNSTLNLIPSNIVSLYSKESSTPTIFQSGVDLGAFSKRQALPPPYSQSNVIYWILYLIGFIFFPAWLVGYTVASLVLKSVTNSYDPSVPFGTTINHLHSRWRARFLNTLSMFAIIAILVAMLVIIVHPSWFPYESKIMTIGEH
ncbi:hypothetical protein L0F63_006493 [Massospora cicadina]|nr:hypothetical protein L0F63_006493 [Massospora cicadina]